MSSIKYTRELLQEAVLNSESIFDVLRFFGISTRSGGSHSHIKKRIRQCDIDTSHFIGIRKNSGPNHKGGPRRKSPKEILIKRDPLSHKEKVKCLRRALIEVGVLHLCGKCGLGSEWNDEPLTLQIDHIDGDTSNNERNNLRFLCPNCHSQTKTYSAIKSRSRRKMRYCLDLDCDNKITRNSKTGFCYKCVQKNRDKWQKQNKAR